MAYDEQLADRIRALTEGPGVAERKMFGGLAFLRRGHMVCGVVGDALMLRLGPARADAALAQPGVRPMDFTGRPMRGMVFVDAPAIPTDDALADWIGQARAFVDGLPPKADASI